MLTTLRHHLEPGPVPISSRRYPVDLLGSWMNGLRTSAAQIHESNRHHTVDTTSLLATDLEANHLLALSWCKLVYEGQEQAAAVVAGVGRQTYGKAAFEESMQWAESFVREEVYSTARYVDADAYGRSRMSDENALVLHPLHTGLDLVQTWECSAGAEYAAEVFGQLSDEDEYVSDVSLGCDEYTAVERNEYAATHERTSNYYDGYDTYSAYAEEICREVEQTASRSIRTWV